MAIPRFYSNLPSIACAGITVISWKSLIRKRKSFLGSIMRLWVRWAVWLALSLMLWTVAAESTHNHPNQNESSSCSICVVAHSTRPTINSSQATPVFAAVATLHVDDVVARTRFDFSDAGIRGPPAL